MYIYKSERKEVIDLSDANQRQAGKRAPNHPPNFLASRASHEACPSRFQSQAGYTDRGVEQTQISGLGLQIRPHHFHVSCHDKID